MAQGLTAGGAILGAGQFGSHPVAFGCALRVDALNRGTGHQGHCEFSLGERFDQATIRADWEIFRMGRITHVIVTREKYCVNEKAREFVSFCGNLVRKF